jgi:hypothetical protein
LHTVATEGVAAICLSEMADERRTEERRHVGRRDKETDRNNDTLNFRNNRVGGMSEWESIRIEIELN